MKCIPSVTGITVSECYVVFMTFLKYTVSFYDKCSWVLIIEDWKVWKGRRKTQVPQSFVEIVLHLQRSDIWSKILHSDGWLPPRFPLYRNKAVVDILMHRGFIVFKIHSWR